MNSATLVPITNRSDKSSLSDADWYHLVPKGEFPHSAGLIQVLDQEAMVAMVNRFNAEAASPKFAGLLIDQEHWSIDTDKSSEAFGWVKELVNRADGIWGRVAWTNLGNAALANKRYKFLSPVWMPNQLERLGNKRFRPLRLDSFGLTNNPNLRGMAPLTNRAGDETPADKTAVQKSKTMKSVATALGLSAEASEEAILAAVTQVKNRAESAEGALAPIRNRVSTLETELTGLRDAQIEEDLKPLTNRAKPEVIASFKSSLKADRDAALPGVQAFIASLDGKAMTPNKPITNRATAGNPGAEAGAGEKKGADPKTAAAIRNRANQISTQEKVPFHDAWARAAAELNPQ